MKCWIVILGAISFLFFACSNSEYASDLPQNPSDIISEDSLLTGMVSIKAAGQKTVLGTTFENAPANARPAMKVKFEYDFWLGKHEVICSEFDSLMQHATGLALNCENDSLPATNLTYYDAVLFANERSKAENYDTAYTYTRAQFDSENHCIDLEGFAYHPEANAFRLPTEAEWVLVASRNWNVDSSWNADNSDYQLHQVCEKVDSNMNFCDLAGNALEFVNDWLGKFRDTTLTNYVGAPDGETLGQRVVKGGSYRNVVKSMNLYSRSDVYTVTSSTRADYVGFRLAFGAIPNAVWMNSSGKTDASRIAPLANSATLKALTGTFQMKLAFRNDLSGNLAYIDYSSGTLSVVEIEDTIEVFHPEISPDGKKVAFCTGLEGISGKSAVYVRNLDAEGSGLVKLDVKSAAIPRWRVLETGDTVIVYVTDAGNNKDEDAFRMTSTAQVKFANGVFGKPQKLFDGAYHDGVSDDNMLAVTGARLLRARESLNDTIWYNGEQACNASLSKDSSKRTLFLDFGSKTGRAFVGKNYSTHERLLVADSNGKLIQSVGAPAGFSFDHSEWAGFSSDLAVATLTNSDGAHQKIVLINLVDSSLVDLVEGDEVWHPCLWVKKIEIPFEKFKLNLDSAGVYMNPNDEWGSVLMRYNMELLWRYRDSINVAIVGSSRPLYSLSPQGLSPEFFAVNFGHTPNSIYASRDFLKKYLLRHLKKLKYIVVSLDIDFWYKNDGPESDNFFAATYMNYPGYVYDENHKYWDDGYPDGLLESTENSISVADDNVYLDDRGRYTKTYCVWWGDPAEIELDSTFYDDQMDLVDNSLDALKEIIEMAKEEDIQVVGMIFPQNPKYKETGAFGRYGMRRSLAKSVIEQIHQMEKKYKNFTLFDENKMGDHDYTDQEAVDSDHLCYVGVPKITARLDSVLRTLK